MFLGAHLYLCFLVNQRDGSYANVESKTADKYFNTAAKGGLTCFGSHLPEGL